MNKRTAISFLAVFLAGVLLVSCAPAAPAPAAPAPAAKPAPGVTPAPAPTTPAAKAKPKMVEIVSPQGPISSSAYRKDLALAELLRRHSEFVRLTPMASKGTTENQTMFLKGQTPGPMHANSQSLFDFVNGRGPFKSYGPQGDKLQIAISHGATQVAVVARADSDIKSIKDLKGKKLAVAQPGSSGYMYALAVTAAAGFDLNKEAKAVFGSYTDSASAMKEGSAVAWIQSSVFTPGSPYPYVEDVANATKLKFISVTKDDIAAMNKFAGGPVYAPAVLPAGVYKNQTANVNWAAVTAYWAVGKDLSEDIVYEIVSTWYNYYDEALEISALAQDVSPAHAKAMLKAEHMTTWHAGALKYYKEKGWI